MVATPLYILNYFCRPVAISVVTGLSSEIGVEPHVKKPSLQGKLHCCNTKLEAQERRKST